MLNALKSVSATEWVMALVVVGYCIAVVVSASF